MIKISPIAKVFCFVLIALIVNNLSVSAQSNYRYKAELPKVDSNGVYKIALTSGLIAKSNTSLSDVRLLNANGKFTAYALSKNIFTGSSGNFVEFPGVKTANTPNTASVYIAENKTGIKTNELWIRLKNTDVRRSVDIYGSDDLKKWFAIKEDIALNQATINKEPDYSQLLQFPTSNYLYFKVQVNGKNKAPVKIEWAGIYVGTLPAEEFAPIPRPQISTRDTNHITHVYVRFDEPYQVNKLHLLVIAPNFFQRHIRIYDDKSGNKLSDTTLDFRGTDLYLSARTKKLRIDIANGDDVPLTIKSVDAFEQQQYLVSYLEAGQQYAILSGDATAATPDYDLSFLKDRPQETLPLIVHSAIQKNPAYVAPKPLPHHNFSVWLWAAIVIAVMVLGFLTWKMVGEIEPKRS